MHGAQKTPYQRTEAHLVSTPGLEETRHNFSERVWRSASRKRSTTRNNAHRKRTTQWNVNLCDFLPRTVTRVASTQSKVIQLPLREERASAVRTATSNTKRCQPEACMRSVSPASRWPVPRGITNELRNWLAFSSERGRMLVIPLPGTC